MQEKGLQRGRPSSLACASSRQIAAKLGVVEEALREQLRRLGRAPARSVQAFFLPTYFYSMYSNSQAR
jgi:hypothetical protein